MDTGDPDGSQLTDGSVNLIALPLGGTFNVNDHILAPLIDLGVKASVTPVISAGDSF